MNGDGTRAATADSALRRLLLRAVDVRPEEIRALAWSFTYFFSVLFSYYIVRPMRDEMGVAGGVENLPWMFTGTFLVMLAAVPVFGWVAGRYPRRQFLPYVYGFFMANVLIFYALFESGVEHAWVARAFFIWASVYNLFVVSVFWSVMADTWRSDQARRLFGFIAAGGTAGALAGPALTAVLVLPLGPNRLLLLSALLLSLAVLSIRKLIGERTGAADGPGRETPMGGSILAGFRLALGSPYLLGICVLMLLYTTLSTFLYFQQAEIIGDFIDDPARRTSLFATMDFAVNGLTILIQLFVTGRLVRLIGLAWTLTLIPLLTTVGFLVLGSAPLLAVLVCVQVMRRAGDYAIMRPGREMLFTVLDREGKYKAKNFIDTAVYRGGDAVSGWAYAGLAALGLGLSAIAFVAVPLATLWAWVGYRLGRTRESMAAVQWDASDATERR
jgi:AAA family ATP:ADP antiporter